LTCCLHRGCGPCAAGAVRGSSVRAGKHAMKVRPDQTTDGEVADRPKSFIACDCEMAGERDTDTSGSVEG
jgi:hypothetical protein